MGISAELIPQCFHQVVYGVCENRIASGAGQHEAPPYLAERPHSFISSHLFTTTDTFIFEEPTLIGINYANIVQDAVMIMAKAGARC